MTITDRPMNRRLEHLQRCAEVAPEDTYESAKRAVSAVGFALDEVRAQFKLFGFFVDNSDACRNLEVEIYRYLLASNGNRSDLAVAEGFGEHVDGAAGKRIMAQTIRDRDELRALVRS